MTPIRFNARVEGLELFEYDYTQYLATPSDFGLVELYETGTPVYVGMGLTQEDAVADLNSKYKFTDLDVEADGWIQVDYFRIRTTTPTPSTFHPNV